MHRINRPVALASQDEFCRNHDEACRDVLVSWVVDGSGISIDSALLALVDGCTVDQDIDQSFSFSYRNTCLSDCPNDVLTAIGDQDAFCALEDTSCMGECGLSSEYIDVHCACASGVLFSDEDFGWGAWDLEGNTFCDGTEVCRGAVAALSLKAALAVGSADFGG